MGLVRRQLEVKDGVAVVHVQSARGEVGDHERAKLAATELGEFFLSFHFIHPPVQDTHWHAPRAEFSLDLFQASTKVAKNQRALHVGGVNGATKFVHFVSALRNHRAVRDVRREADDALHALLPRRRRRALLVSRVGDVRFLYFLVLPGRRQSRRRRLVVRRDDVRQVWREIRVRIERFLLQRRAHDDRLSSARHRFARVFADSRHVSSKVTRQQIVRLIDDQRFHPVRL
mmetsp:Transcript_6530/g.26192  ORF Transcript_6530/g.26192 Transcript_6530/m.26192 type:complete len:230 (-) Transcript_6530:748-1437(-)